MKTVIIALFCFCLMGCSGCPGERTPEQIKVRHDIVVASLLPPNYENLKDLGKDWYTFDLNVSGQKRTFLFHWWHGSYGELGSCVTELR